MRCGSGPNMDSHPRVVQEAHELPTLFALARAGVGIAVVPISACRAGIRRVRVHPISDKEARWTLGAAWRKGEKSVLDDKFLGIVEERIKESQRIKILESRMPL